MATPKAPKYRFNRSDFKPLPLTLEHMDIGLNFLADGRVAGENTLYLTARKALRTVTLDACELEIAAVEWARKGEEGPLAYDYRKASRQLVITLPRPVRAGESLILRTRVFCTPNEHVLEGIYKDTTPPGCPQQYMSQCQQWGFQRILPVLDDCTAKCTMRTTIEADARYTHLISNGNIDRVSNPDGRPVPKPGDPSRQVITYENLIPMAPYLFLVCVGTWEMLADAIRYPSGRTVRLEYLVPPGRLAGARLPMAILKDSIRWHGRTQDYEYVRDVYRTICMEKSNFGGMENVGNTTIITDAALIDEWTGDRRLEYAHGVIVHEFEHNQCGSDVTMATPFDMWLNEAFTVDVERQYLMDCLDADVMRLDEVDSMRAPLFGPLAIEDGGHMGNIVREGFNDPDELVDGVTYVKAAEVIRMLRLILGPVVFRKAKNLYFRRYNGGNANTDQFFACFEEVSGRDLTAFKRQWLYTIGYPRVEARSRYDRRKRRLTITFAQSYARARPGYEFFHVPIELAAVNARGQDLRGTRQVVALTGRTKRVVFDRIPEPAFLSLNRDCSFYGVFHDASATPVALRRQVRLDRNHTNRVEAMRRLTDAERIKLIEDPAAPIDPEWLALYGEIVVDPDLSPGLKSYLLRIDEQSLDRRYLPFYRERYAARMRLLDAVVAAHFPALRRAFSRVNTYRRGRRPTDGMAERGLKAVLLRGLIQADTPEAQALAEAHFRKAWNISDRESALYCLNLSSHPRRRAIMEAAYEQWQAHLSAYASYLRIVASGVHEDVFDRIAEEEARPTFKIHHPTFSRGLFLPLAANNKMLWTARGMEWLTDTVIRMAPINENTAIRLLAGFQMVKQLAPDLRAPVVAGLARMQQAIAADTAPSVRGRVDAYLAAGRPARGR